VIRGLLELVSDQANRDTPPQWSDTGREFLAKRRPKAADKPANDPANGPK